MSHIELERVKLGRVKEYFLKLLHPVYICPEDLIGIIEVFDVILLSRCF
jgi:hypothetical protein